MLTSEQTDLATQLSHATITALNFYPIKSCAGTPLTEAQLTARGIAHDREFMLVDATGTFLTQRELPRMALIHPTRAADVLHVTAPDMPELVMPVITDAPEHVPVRIWRDTCDAVDQGGDAAQWFSQFLGITCRLVRMAPDYVRHVNQDFALTPQDQVSFADGYPLLIISEESLADLNQRITGPRLPMNRFRPNIVIAGAGLPFGEDRLRRFCVGELTFHVVKPCKRCPIPTTDQTTAIVGKEPLKTLAKFRRLPDDGVIFGQNVIHSGPGTIRVGQALTALAVQPGPLV